jgi:hypothetical protein
MDKILASEAEDYWFDSSRAHSQFVAIMTWSVRGDGMSVPKLAEVFSEIIPDIVFFGTRDRRDLLLTAGNCRLRQASASQVGSGTINLTNAFQSAKKEARG